MMTRRSETPLPNLRMQEAAQSKEATPPLFTRVNEARILMNIKVKNE